MKKNILVITGSPRKGGNSDMLASAFIEGAEKKGHTVNRFDTRNKKISGCIACNNCWKTGYACSIPDDFRLLEPLLEEADVIAFVSPLYWFGMSAQIKSAIDRFYAYGTKPLKVQESLLLMCGETDDEADFKGPVESYKSMIQYLTWKERGILTVLNANAKGDILKTDGLSRAKELGEAV